MLCVNALSGLLSFLQNNRWSKQGKDGCVNALSGLLSFLQRLIINYHMEIILCQRPKRASFISTRTEQLEKLILQYVSTP